MADQLKTLLEYRSRPEIREPIVPVKTNWTATQANDIAAPEEMADLHIDRQREIIPSIAEIMREANTGEVVRNDVGAIIAIGKLHFSDGTNKERAYTRGPEGKIIRYDAPMPVGAMLHAKERLTRDRGPSQRTHISDGRLASLMGVAHREHAPGNRTKRTGKSYSAIESKAMLAAAIANTPKMPEPVICQPGLAAGSIGASDAFFGMKKGKKGESGAIGWQDVCSMMVERETWEATERYLSERDVTALDAAMDAGSVTHVGTSLGYGAEYSRRKGGMRALLAANDNLRLAKRVAA